MPEPDRNTLYTTHPGKFAYTFYSILLGIARLPLWMIYFIPTGLRQHPKWTWKQAVGVRFVRAFLYWCCSVEMVTPYNLTPGSEKDQWVTFVPAKSKHYTGVATADPEIKPGKTGATWYPSVPAKSATKVVLHFHGGAFVIGDGRVQDCGFLAGTLLKEAKVNYVCAVNYRLASNDGGRFPAALQDAITSYIYLTETLQISPRDIIFSGDSAGGNLVLCLLKYIANYGNVTGLTTPAAAWLWSPWVDPVGGTDPVRYYKSPNGSTDYVAHAFGVWGARCYMPLQESKLNDSYIDFKHHPFKTGVPLYFSIGGAEMLLEDDIETAEQFERVGNNVTKSLEEYCPHDIMLVGKNTNFDKEAAVAAQKAGTWLRNLN
ncbi:MAG: hypothetical protein GOMPHAMPRED_000756 [Gomphillus americanus]|uniref:Alpha/beta hydrolase fold-3 domain-containing protein n=1 Tax=Gomphillus americanus TaxID=1940652 RepID=A0A8H3F3N1_9LECA|nr:MAG: hypothetical protein GOMPHAMPRED_000756 [Gomphillus americanus]